MHHNPLLHSVIAKKSVKGPLWILTLSMPTTCVLLTLALSDMSQLFCRFLQVHMFIFTRYYCTNMITFFLELLLQWWNQIYFIHSVSWSCFAAMISDMRLHLDQVQIINRWLPKAVPEKYPQNGGWILTVSNLIPPCQEGENAFYNLLLAMVGLLFLFLLIVIIV